MSVGFFKLSPPPGGMPAIVQAVSRARLAKSLQARFPGVVVELAPLDPVKLAKLRADGHYLPPGARHLADAALRASTLKAKAREQAAAIRSRAVHRSEGKATASSQQADNSPPWD